MKHQMTAKKDSEFAGSLLLAAVALPPCKTNEVLVACSHPDSVCGKPLPLFCSLLCGPKACRCRFGYSRNAAGQCVANGMCKPTPPLKSVIPTCKANEDFVLCSRPEATCANPKPQPTPIGPAKCQCTGGFARLGVNCVPFGKCPTTSTSTSTSTTTTTTSTITFVSCDDGWSYFRKACYIVSRIYGTQPAAKASCAMNGAHLVTITDASEHDFVGQLLSRSGAPICAFIGATDCPMWLGLERVGVDNLFKWVDDTPYVFQDWRSGEPNNSNCNEFCVELHSSGDWNDADCGAKRIWMCEKPANIQSTG
ncbi:C-type lectin [Aphelenchoides avenae]|nr:C-type lectin [Aphelenchus avenae]